MSRLIELLSFPLNLYAQAEQRLMSGDMTREQHGELMERLQQLYELQRQKERLKQLQQGEDMLPPQEGPHPPQQPHPDHMAFQAGPPEPLIRGNEAAISIDSSLSQGHY